MVIVGGSTSGTAAAVEASRAGGGALSILLVEETPWLGGMLTAAGVSATDGNHNLCGGIWREFRDSLIVEYGSQENLHTGWVSYTLFEPSVGNRIFQNIVAGCEGIDYRPSTQVTSFKKLSKGGWALTLSNGEHIRTRMLIDATELGDVAKTVGIPYEVSNVPQDLTYTVTLKDYGTPTLIEKPASYDPENYRGCCHSEINPDGTAQWPAWYMLQYGALPRGKYMINWPLHGNDYYVDLIDMSPEERAAAIADAKNYALGFIYFLQNELWFPNLGIAKGEYPTEDGLPLIPYYREARRIEGEVRLEIEDIQHPTRNKLFFTGIAVGDYPVDQHHNAYKGPEVLEDYSCYPIPAYSIPLGVMVPKGFDDMLVIEKSISVSAKVSGSTRLQPVTLQLGQAAGALAALCLQQGIQARDVNVREVQNILLEHGAYIEPTSDVDPLHPAFKAIQRAVAVGLLGVEGKTEAWTNYAFFYPDAPYKGSRPKGMRPGLTRAEAAAWFDSHFDLFEKPIDLQGNNK